MEFGTQEALVLVTVGLVLATGVLALYTWRLWQETKAARQPQVVAYIDFVTHNYGELRFVNAGAGAAVSLNITYGGEGGHERRLREPVMPAGEGWSYKLLSVLDKEEDSTRDTLESVLQVFSTMVVSGTYKDVRGKTYKIDQVIDIETLHEEAKQGRRLRAFRGPLLSFHQLGTQIARELASIA